MTFQMGCKQTMNCVTLTLTQTHYTLCRAHCIDVLSVYIVRFGHCIVGFVCAIPMLRKKVHC